MSLQIDQFTIEVVPRASARLDVEPAWDDGIAWHFEILRPTPHHIAAVCHNARDDAGPVPVTVLPDTWASLNATHSRPIR